MRVRLGVIAAVVGFGLVCAAGSTDAQRNKRKRDVATIARGIALYNDLEYEKAITVLEKALEDPPGDTDETVEGYKTLALSYMALGQEEKALETFKQLLQIKADYQLPKTLSKQARSLFDKARAAIPKPEPPPSLTLSHRIEPLHPKPGAAVSMKVQVSNDDQDLHRRVVVFHRTRGSSDYSSVWAEPTSTDGEYTVTISGAAVAAPALEYYLAAVDETGGVVAELGSKSEPLALVIGKESAGATPIYGKWWFWAGLGGAVVAGIVIATTVGGDDGGAGASVTITVNPPAQ